MAQIFHPSANTLAKVSIIAIVVGLPLLGCAGYAMNMTYGYKTYLPIEQPVQFSHKHHVGDDGLDCRYCHTSVDKSAHAGIPATETCMTCHSQIWSDSPELLPVKQSFETGKPMEWTRVHDLPDFAYFSHEIHVNKGIGCESCHGRIDQMPLVKKVHTLSMNWCVDCHRNPEKHIRPKNKVYEMGWDASQEINPETKKPETQASLGARLIKEHKILPPDQLTNCSVCHR